MLAEKVVKLNKTEIYDQINLFLDKKHMRSGSDKTRESYERDINDFFYYLTKGTKEVKFLTIDDIQINDDDIINFQIHLKNKGLVNKSINRKVSTVNQLYGRFFRKGYIKNLSSFEEADRLKEGKNYHGVLTVNEVFHMTTLVLNQKRGRKKLTKYFLLLLAMDTCLRKSALLNLTWSDFIEHVDFVEIKAVDKGNEERNLKISKEFYQELLQLKEESKTDKVFDISETSIQDMMDYLKSKMKIEEKRRICFHSVRKCGVSFQYRISGLDIMQAKKAAGHSNLNTTQIYVGETDYGILGAVSSRGQIDDALFEKVSHEELLEGIRNLNKDQILLLNIKLNEINSKN
ncbi:tyrosine-type recombinase/integrase [Cytobacillus praedii]|uniref:Site-specific integrase n=1 Tax=Cytobacillus praedii TaxID=1742358 RepID=A0A4V2NTJ3_9BACI|nr:site-specific integrase [Cytobacillus praedii]TCJ00418.1 site-specific integrase [Cytobacillus praedii]